MRCASLRHLALRLVLLLPLGAGAEDDALPLPTFTLPPGFTLEVVSDDLPNARQLALGPEGTLFAGTRRDGRVWALKDGVRYTLAEGLNLPSGVAVHNGDLYVAAVSHLYRLPNVEKQLETPPALEVITDALPTDKHHGWKHIEFSAAGDLFIPVGAPCNICDPEPPYASLLRMDPRTGAFEIYARGIRNTVGFDFEPGTGALWFSDNGRDMLGDEIPPEELNRITAPGAHFGYPYVHGGVLLDPEFGDGHRLDAYEAPAFRLPAHSAPLGLAFYTGSAFPERYQGALFLAEHGSWNRSSKIGYQVSVAFLEDGRITRLEPFLTGFLRGEETLGRPVDVLVEPEGTLLVSDDHRGAVYRIRYTGPQGATPTLARSTP